MVGNVKLNGAPVLDGFFSDAIEGVTSAVSTWFTGKSKEDTTKAYQEALKQQYKQQEQLADLLKYALLGTALVIGLNSIK